MCWLKFYYRSHFISGFVTRQRLMRYSRSVTADFETHYRGITVAVIPLLRHYRGFPSH